MRKFLALMSIALVILMLPLLFWDTAMSAMEPVGQDRSAAPVRRPVRTGEDKATRAARDISQVVLQITTRDESERQAALRLGTVIENYNSMIVIAVRKNDLEAVRKKAGGLDFTQLETEIHLRDFSFDPLLEEPAREYKQSGGFREYSASDGDYHLVQFIAPVRDEWIEELKAAGGQVLQYVPHQAYFVYASDDAIATIRRHPRVRWAGDFHPVYKVAPELRSAYESAQTQQPGKTATPPAPDGYDIAVFKNADLNDIGNRVTALGAAIRHRIVLPSNYFNVLRVEMDPSLVKQAAALSGVIAVDPYYKPQKEDERSAQIVAGNFVNATTLNAPGYNSLAQFGVDGTSVTVSVVDDGVGIPGDGGFYITSSNAVNGPLRGATVGANGHGHLNATIISGDLPFSTLDPLGYNYALGVARKSHIVNIPLLRSGYTGTEADTANDTVITAGPNGVFGFISNNSWGAGTNGNAYDSFAAQFDGFVRDASTAASIDPLSIIFSAGNSGVIGLTRPKMAKNVIAVANSENIRPELTGSANNLEDMAPSSSRGPANDGRIKPDITAPGTGVSGGRSGPDVLFGNIDAAHRWSIGTSHAAPQIAGAAALFTQQWKNNNAGANPSPALVKAALINGAQEMTGTGASNPIPNGDEGWGRLNLKNVLNTGVPINYINQTAGLFNPGETFSMTGTIATASRHFRATLVWTDPPGVSDPSLVNNLDLEVVVGGMLYKGNVFAGGQSMYGGVADTRNNVENVFLPAGIAAGTPVSVRVRATALNGDGILSNGDATDQHFALVVFNSAAAPATVIAVTNASLTSESCAPANGVIDPGETVTIGFSLQNTGSVGASNVVATLQSTGGVTSPSGPQTYGALSAGGAAVTRSFTFTSDPALACGDSVTTTFALQDGATNLGTATFTFMLGTLSSSTFSYTGAPVAIPDGNAAGVNIPLAVSGFSGNIADLDFRIDGTTCTAIAGSTTVGVDHTWVGDLIFKLTSPAGTTVTFIERPGGNNNSGNNLCQVLLDDEAFATRIGSVTTTGAPPLGPPYTGTFNPQNPLSAFDGQNPNGAWTLNVSDLVAVDSGSVRAFSLVLKKSECCSGCPLITVNPAGPSLPDGMVGTPYSQTFTATGGASPYAFSISAGTAPTGLALSPGGVLSGNPVATGTFNFTVKATDNNGCMGTRSYSLTINPGALANLQYYPLPSPVRLLDTRPGESGCFTPGAPLGNNAVRLQTATGACSGIPSTAKAIVGNATVVNFISTGFHWITLYPSNAPQPNASNLNFSDNQIVPNSFTVGLGTDGAFNIYSHAPTHFIVDVTGYYAPPGMGGLYYHPLPAPVRLFDSRPGETACDAPGAPLADNGTRTVTAHGTCLGATIPTSAKAIIGNATVVNFISSGFNWITLYPFGTSQPNASNLNFTANEIVPNAFVTGLSSDGKFNIFSRASTHFIVDVNGYFSDQATDVNGAGLFYNPLPTPVRLLDTRPGEMGCDAPGIPLGDNATRTQLAHRTCFGVTIPSTAKAIDGNATVVNFISMGFNWITLYPFGAAQPNASNLNFHDNHIVPNAFQVGLSSDGKFNIYSRASTHFIVDVTGFFSP
jgi:hypothetical protein